MVKLLNKNNVGKFANIIYNILKIQQNFMTHFTLINVPEVQPCIYATWHSDQFALSTINNKENLNVLISNSIDGEVITRVIEKMGFKVVRGSSNRKGCISSTMQLISRLKNGECAAIMVDGPRGPLHKIKGGIVAIAKEAGVPIVPLHWYSGAKNFFYLPSWDKMTTPLFNCHIVSIFGDPIYITEEMTKEEAIDKVRLGLEHLDKIAPEEYKKAKKEKKWIKIKSK